MAAVNPGTYRVRVVQLLVNEIPHRATAQIIDSAQGLRGHLAEFEVQRMMTNLLSLHLPSPELVDRRARHWAQTALAYDVNSFAQRAAPRIIDDTVETKYVARPAMASVDGHVSCYAWEILRLDDLASELHGDFHFEASMSAHYSATKPT